MSHNHQNLQKHILSLSEANNFYQARLEWSLIHIEIHESWDQCPCGKQIKELCYIKNKINGKKTYVGNVCINNFLGIKTGNLFNGLKKIKNDPKANPNLDLIEHAYELGYLHNIREKEFLLQTRLKRNLSPKQQSWKEKINRRILNKTVVMKK